MTDNFYLALAAILIFPLIPAFFIYKYLPVGKGDDVDVSGPFSGLSLKLKGAFAAYFLLVLKEIKYLSEKKRTKIEK